MHPLSRFFSSDIDASRRRRPTDLILLVISLLVVVGLSVAAPGPTELDTNLTASLQSLPGIAGWLFEISYALLNLWAIVLLLLCVATRGRRRLLGEVLLAGLLAFGVSMMASGLAGSDLDQTLQAFLDVGPPPVYMAVRLAVVTAVVITASPHLSAPMRYVGRGVITVGAIASIALGMSFPIGAVAAFFVGVGAAALTHLLLGSPGGQPSAAAVSESLVDLGVSAHGIHAADVTFAGATMMSVTDATGKPLLVKVFGRDAWDGQFVTSAWTSLVRVGQSPQLFASRLERVEHEAVATLMAQRAGVPVLPLVAVGKSAEGDALLVTEAPGQPLSAADSPLTHQQITQLWDALRTLHDEGIVHGHLDAEHIYIDEDAVAMRGFEDSHLGADDTALMSDRAMLLVTTALVTDHEHAVAAAQAGIGDEGLAELLPYLQPAVLDRGTRRDVRSGSWDLKTLREHASRVCGTEPPQLAKVARVTPRSVITTILIGIIAYGLISALAGVDFQSIAQELASANFVMLGVALVLSPLIQVFLAFGTMGASVTPIRYVPALMLQYAIQFLALCVPASAARVGLEVRFFQRFGVSSTGAVSVGMIDSFSGFIVQILLFVGISLSALPGFTSTPSLTGDSSSDSSSSGPSLAALFLVLIVLGAVTTMVVPRWRQRALQIRPRIQAIIKAQSGEARHALSVLRHPGKAASMIGGNLVAQFLQAFILLICLNAFGQTAHMSQMILINTCVSLFAGLMPVPGGMGVAEAGYTAGLTAIGIPSAVAVSTAIAFRLVTFYLPPLWGAPAMGWMRRHSYV